MPERGYQDGDARAGMLGLGHQDLAARTWIPGRGCQEKLHSALVKSEKSSNSAEICFTSRGHWTRGEAKVDDQTISNTAESIVHLVQPSNNRM